MAPIDINPKVPSASANRKRKRGDNFIKQHTHPADLPLDLSFANLSRKGTSFSSKRQRVADGSAKCNSGKAVSEEHHSSLTPVGAVPPVPIFGERKCNGRVPEANGNKRSKDPHISRWNSTTTHHAPGFWDTLPHIFLTRRALQEFDRRNALGRITAKRNLSHISRSSGKDRIELSTVRRASPHLRRFARAGGPDLSDINGYPLPRSVKMMRTRSSSRLARQDSNMGPPDLPASRTRPPAEVDAVSNTGTSVSGKSNAYDNNFMTQLAREGVQPLSRDHEPANIHEWKRRLAQPRAALSSGHFSEAQHKTFLRAMDSAFSEGKVILKLFPTIIGDAEYHSDVNRPCTNWEAFGDANVVVPQPDYLEGARQSAENEEVRHETGPIVMPFAAYEALFLPNFFTEAKGLRGTLDVAQRQACYDGALGTRCMHVLQNLGSERKVYDGNSYTITSTYVGGTLKLFLHHITPPKGPEHKPNYHMTPLKGWLLEDYDTFREGVSWYQNARDVADEYRQQFLEAATSRLRAAAQQWSLSVSSERTLRTASREGTEQDHAGSETSPNNSDMAQVSHPTKRPRKPAAGPKPKNKSATVTKARAKRNARSKGEPNAASGDHES